jgi:hypothetical protein
MAKFQQAVLKGDEVVAVVTASDHGAVAAGARKAGLPIHGLRAVRMMDYVSQKKEEVELVWEVDEIDPDCSKKDAEIIARRNRR